MMIDKRLINQVPDAKKYIGKIIFVNWIGLILNILIIFNIAEILNLNFSYIETRVFCIILFILLKMFFNFLAGKLAYYTSVKVKEALREKIYNKILNVGACYNQYVSTAELVQVSVEGVEQLEIYFSRYLPQLFYSLLAPLTLFFVIQEISFISALLLLICVPLIPLSIIAVQKLAKKLFRKYWNEYTTLGDSFLDNLQGITTLKIYNADERKNEEMNKQAEIFRKITMRVLVMQLNSVSLMDLLAFGGAALGVILAVTQLINGNIDFVGAVVIILLASEFFIPLRLLGSFFHIAMNGMSASEKIFKIIDIEEKENRLAKIQDGNIVIKNLNFGYEDRNILQNINLSLEEGQIIALAGESGCGKSTIASLITTIKEGYSGEILISGSQVRDISEQDLMKNITLITHNSYIFKGTIEENLKMAKSDATIQEMEQVLEQVNLLDFVKSQKDGLQFKLDEKGSNLSGGQAQRLALARAILHNSKIYIFDESTSNIDIESEDIIIKNIYDLARKHKKTVLIISHRLANITHTDKIYVMEKGEIKESGTHTELIQNKGVYHNLYEKQKKLESYNSLKEVVL